MTARIDLGDIAVEVVFKDIKNIHLSVYPPDGKVRIAAPARMSLDTLRVFAVSKLAWIRQRQRKLREQARETPRELLDRESHTLWGTRYLLKVVEEDAAPAVLLKPRTLVLRVRPGTSEEKKQAIVAGWYRQQIKEAAAELIAQVGAHPRGEGKADLRSAHEDTMGRLQYRVSDRSASTRSWPRSPRSAWNTSSSTSWCICWSATTPTASPP